MGGGGEASAVLLRGHEPARGRRPGRGVGGLRAVMAATQLGKETRGAHGWGPLARHAYIPTISAFLLTLLTHTRHRCALTAAPLPTAPLPTAAATSPTTAVPSRPRPPCPPCPSPALAAPTPSCPSPAPAVPLALVVPPPTAPAVPPPCPRPPGTSPATRHLARDPSSRPHPVVSPATKPLR
eukprot:XP_020397090.1 vegetative cell wall protein gp1-like [Zea mays]